MSRALSRYNTNASCCGGPEKPPNSNLLTNKYVFDDSESEVEGQANDTDFTTTMKDESAEEMEFQPSMLIMSTAEEEYGGDRGGGGEERGEVEDMNMDVDEDALEAVAVKATAAAEEARQRADEEPIASLSYESKLRKGSGSETTGTARTTLVKLVEIAESADREMPNPATEKGSMSSCVADSNSTNINNGTKELDGKRDPDAGSKKIEKKRALDDPAVTRRDSSGSVTSSSTTTTEASNADHQYQMLDRDSEMKEAGNPSKLARGANQRLSTDEEIMERDEAAVTMQLSAGSAGSPRDTLNKAGSTASLAGRKIEQTAERKSDRKTESSREVEGSAENDRFSVTIFDDAELTILAAMSKAESKAAATSKSVNNSHSKSFKPNKLQTKNSSQTVGLAEDSRKTMKTAGYSHNCAGEPEAPPEKDGDFNTPLHENESGNVDPENVAGLGSGGQDGKAPGVKDDAVDGDLAMAITGGKGAWLADVKPENAAGLGSGGQDGKAPGVKDDAVDGNLAMAITGGKGACQAGKDGGGSGTNNVDRGGMGRQGIVGVGKYAGVDGRAGGTGGVEVGGAGAGSFGGGNRREAGGINAERGGGGVGRGGTGSRGAGAGSFGGGNGREAGGINAERGGGGVGRGGTGSRDAGEGGTGSDGYPRNHTNGTEETDGSRWIPGEGRRWPTSICYPPTNYEWGNSFYHGGKMWDKTYILSAIEAWSYYSFDSDFWKDYHYDSLISPSLDRMERSLLVPREMITALALIMTAIVIAMLGDDAGGEEIVFILALTYPVYATLKSFDASEPDRGEIVHWIGYWMAYYLLCIEPATFNFLTYWWLPFRQVIKGLMLLWLVIPRLSRPPQRPLPSPSMVVSEGLQAAEAVRDRWVTTIVEEGKEHYARVMTQQGFGGGGGGNSDSSGDPLKPGIKGWGSLGSAFLMSCFYLFLESYH